MSKGLKALEKIINSMSANHFEYQVKELETIEKELKALDILLSHLSIVEPINDTTLVFDIDLWDTGKQKEDFKFIKEMLDEHQR